ncbi:MAG: hypothetical protein LBB07_00175, partial [Bifidobacteriaceae bacterium]|nr:hypothetical protein [Bifidobacteriaceae bacterium]
MLINQTADKKNILDAPIENFVREKNKRDIFKNMGIFTCKDALYYFPYRIESFKFHKTISDANYA